MRGVDPSARDAFTSAPPAMSAATARASLRWTASISAVSPPDAAGVVWANAGAATPSARVVSHPRIDPRTDPDPRVFRIGSNATLRTRWTDDDR